MSEISLHSWLKPEIVDSGFQTFPVACTWRGTVSTCDSIDPHRMATCIVYNAYQDRLERLKADWPKSALTYKQV